MTQRVPWILIGLLLLLVETVRAETLVTSRPIRAGETLMPGDVDVTDRMIDGALGDLSMAIGLEARRNLYPGQPLFDSDLQEPRMVERNQVVSISFNQGGLHIVTEGRALDEGAIGDTIRVLNSSSRKTVSGTILSDGSVLVTRATQ